MSVDVETLKLDVERLKQRDRERDRESGILASVDAGLSAVANGQRQLSARQDAHAAELRQLRKDLLRLQALPLGGLAHLVAGQAEGDVMNPRAFGVALVVLVVFALVPELRSVLGRIVGRPSSSATSDPPPHPRANGTVPHTDPPNSDTPRR